MRKTAAVVTSILLCGAVLAACGGSGSGSPATTETATVPSGKLGAIATPVAGRYAGADDSRRHSISFTFDGARFTNVKLDDVARFGDGPFPLVNGTYFEARSTNPKVMFHMTVSSHPRNAWGVIVKYPAAPDNPNLNWEMYANLAQ